MDLHLLRWHSVPGNALQLEIIGYSATTVIGERRSGMYFQPSHSLFERISGRATVFLGALERYAQELSDGSVRSRAIVCAIALTILFIRIPGTFLRPEFWAEDAILFSDAYNFGWVSIFESLAGYSNLYGRLVANLAVYFPPITWPWFVTYGANLVAMSVVFMATSPRFDMPYRGLAAIAVVAAPASRQNILGALANAQWVLPLGLIVVLFSRRSERRLVRLGESAFTAVASLQGPMGCFLVPMFAYRAYRSKREDRAHAVTLFGILACGSLIQIGLVATHMGVFGLVNQQEYDPILWLTMPIRWFEGAKLDDLIGHGLFAAVIVLIGAGIIARFAMQEPYRFLKVTMLAFAAAILYSGMIKYRHHLDFNGNDRYAYAGSIFFFWFLCVVAASRERLRDLTVGIVILCLFASTWRRANETRAMPEIPWTEASTKVGRGPVTIPVAPAYPWAIQLLR